MDALIKASLQGLNNLLAEAVLGLFILIIIAYELVLPSPKKNYIITATAAIVCLVVGCIFLGTATQPSGTFFSEHFHKEPWMRPVKVCLLAGYFLSLFALPWQGKKRLYGWWVCLLSALFLGSALLVSAYSLLAMYLSLETISIASYLLVPLHMNRKDYRAGLRYMLFGLVATGMSLYGFSLWYGISGHAHLFSSGAYASFAAQPSWVGAAVFCMVCAAFFFKISLFPMHLWTPAAYARMPLAGLSFVSTLSKGVAMIALWKLSTLFQQHTLYPYVMGIFISSSILVGCLGALRQKEMRGLLAYSAIAYAGFLGLPLLSMPHVPDGVAFSALFFGWIVYTLAYYALWLVTTLTDAHGVRSFKDFYQLRQVPVAKATLLIALLALIGMPPTAGITAKLLLFSTVTQSFWHAREMVYLMVMGIALAGNLLSLYFYAKPLYYLFLRPAKDHTRIKMCSKKVAVALMLLSLGLMVPFVAPDWLVRWVVQP